MNERASINHSSPECKTLGLQDHLLSSTRDHMIACYYHLKEIKCYKKNLQPKSTEFHAVNNKKFAPQTPQREMLSYCGHLTFDYNQCKI